MRVGVLGPILVSVGGGSVVPRAMQPRQVLALLALRANDPVPMEEIKCELWGSSPPLSAVTVVQNYVGAIRKALACRLGGREAALAVLSTGRAGYRLRIEPAHLDVVRFEQHVREGSRALAHRSAEPATEALQRALSTWRGPVLCDVDRGPVLAAEAERLDTLRLLAVEQHLDASLRLGRHYEMLGEMAALVERYPLAERLHQLYMIALHRTGRRAEALQVYERLHRSLGDQLGLTPTPSMQRARHAIVHAAELRAEDAPSIETYRGPVVVRGPLPSAGATSVPSPAR